MEIFVCIVGNFKGVRNGGVLCIVNCKFCVKVLFKDFLDFIEVDIIEMCIGNKMYIGVIE